MNAAFFELHPLQNPLKIELTKGFWAAEGVPLELIEKTGKLQVARDLVTAGLARWDNHVRFGQVLKAVGNGLWNEVQAEERIVAANQ